MKLSKINLNKLQGSDLLTELEQLSIIGGITTEDGTTEDGTTEDDIAVTVNIGKSCKPTWADCKIGCSA
jgi:hypothetical protein